MNEKALRAAVVLLLVHAAVLALSQGRYCIDDAYISFRYAANWAEGHGPVFNLGERVDGYTNFGWMAVLAAAHRVGLPVPDVARLLSLLAAVVGVVWVGRARGVGTSAAAVLLAACGSWARWGQDGLEGVAFAVALLGGALLGLAQDRRRAVGGAGVLFAFATLLRPDGALWFAAAWGLRLVLPGRSLRSLAGDAVSFLLIVAPWAAWRWGYYGWPLPNTFYAKVGDSSAQVARGVRYVGWFALLYLPLFLLAADELRQRLVDRAERRAIVILLGPVVVHLAYVAAVGGDWMGPGRFGLAVLPPLALVAGTAAARRGWGVRHLAGVVLVLLGMSSAVGEAPGVRSQRAYQDSRAVLGAWLADHAGPEDRLLTGEIGQLAWDSGLHTIDHYGLIHAEIAHKEVEGLGEGKAGHEKSDLNWAFEQRPTWVVLPFFYPLLEQGNAGGPLVDFELVHVASDLPVPHFGKVLHRASEPTAMPLEVRVPAPGG